MSRPITAIRNLGPATAEAFARAGITTADEIEALGADEAYRLWLRAGNPPHFIGYYVLVMGLQGRPWNDCTGKEKEALRARFDALKSEARDMAAPPDGLGRARLDAALNEIGLLPRRQAQGV